MGNEALNCDGLISKKVEFNPLLFVAITIFSKQLTSTTYGHKTHKILKL